MAAVRWAPPRRMVRAKTTLPSRMMQTLVRSWPKSMTARQGAAGASAIGATGSRETSGKATVDHRRRVQRPRVHPVRVGRGQERGQVLAPGGRRQHRRPVGPLRGHQVIEHHVLDRVHDLALQLVADHLVDLARLRERQVQHPHRQLVAGDGHVRRHLAAQVRQRLARRLHLPVQQRRVPRRDQDLVQPAERGRAEPGLQQRQLDGVGPRDRCRKRCEPCGCRYSSRQYCRTPAAFSEAALVVSKFSIVRPVSTMAVIFFFTRPDSPVDVTR